jgi:FixJ family two-component response regulator
MIQQTWHGSSTSVSHLATGQPGRDAKAGREPAPPAPDGQDRTGPLVRILDDDRSVRLALGKLMEIHEIEAHAFASVAEFLASDDGSRPGCLLLDLGLPGISGLEFQTQLAGLRIHLPVIIITGHADVPMTVQAMKAGAVEFLTKPFRQKDVIEAVLAAVAVDRNRRLGEARAADLRRRFETLSDRERQMMQFVIAGLRNKAIAAELSLSVVTVKLYRAAMMRKMGTTNVVELVQMAGALERGN